MEVIVNYVFLGIETDPIQAYGNYIPVEHDLVLIANTIYTVVRVMYAPLNKFYIAEIEELK